MLDGKKNVIIIPVDNLSPQVLLSVNTKECEQGKKIKAMAR